MNKPIVDKDLASYFKAGFPVGLLTPQYTS
jgi:hypothetical protein